MEKAINRKRIARIVFCAFIVLIALCVLFVAYVLIPHAKTFTSGGMQITLTDDFRSFETEDYAAVYYSDDIVIYAEKDLFSKFEGIENESCEEYGVFACRNVITDGVQTEDGLTFFYFERVYVDTKQVCPTVVYIYKTDDAFWLVQFKLANDNFDAYADKITKWAKSVQFTS